MNQLTTVILAAGHGKRMKSNLPKVLHKIGGNPMVKHVIDVAYSVDSNRVVVVVGHGKDQVMSTLENENVIFAEQKEQLGTGHAVMMAKEHFGSGDVLVLFGDAPLLSHETLALFIDYHKKNNFGASLISMQFEDPTGYGRIVRDGTNAFKRIVEHKDADADLLKIKEVNSGIGIFKSELLSEGLKHLQNDNQQGEYYLTDVFEWVLGSGNPVGAFIASDSAELMGVNDRVALSQAEKYLQNKLVKKHMLNGVTFLAPETVYLGKEVLIGQDTVVYPGSILLGNTSIGQNCIIGPNADLNHVIVEEGVHIKQSTLVESKVGSYSKIGPYAYLRPNSMIGKNVKIGDFVEVKNSTIGDDTKVSHLTYVGDGVVGKNVNLGCGVVFVNYNGKSKHITEVEDNVFVGCNSNLIAPVKIGKGAYVAAGSTITDDVPGEALAIARQRQVNKTEWSNKYTPKK